MKVNSKTTKPNDPENEQTILSYIVLKMMVIKIMLVSKNICQWVFSDKYNSPE